MDLFLKNYKCYIVFNQACVKIMKCCTIRKEHLNSLYSFYQDFFSLDQFLLMILFHIILILKITFMKKKCTYFSLKSQMLREYVIRQSIQPLNQHNSIIEYFHCSSLSFNVHASLQVTYLQSKTFASNILTQNSTWRHCWQHMYMLIHVC